MIAKPRMPGARTGQLDPAQVAVLPRPVASGLTMVIGSVSIGYHATSPSIASASATGASNVASKPPRPHAEASASTATDGLIRRMVLAGAAGATRSRARRSARPGSRAAPGSGTAAQRPEERAQLLGEQLGLLQRAEVAAARQLGPAADVEEPLGPLARRPRLDLGEHREPGGHLRPAAPLLEGLGDPARDAGVEHVL